MWITALITIKIYCFPRRCARLKSFVVKEASLQQDHTNPHGKREIACHQHSIFVTSSGSTAATPREKGRLATLLTKRKP
jgi:hypothetical protein